MSALYRRGDQIAYQAHPGAWFEYGFVEIDRGGETVLCRFWRGCSPPAELRTKTNGEHAPRAALSPCPREVGASDVQTALAFYCQATADEAFLLDRRRKRERQVLEERAEMVRRYGSKFALCSCGSTVLMFRRPNGVLGGDNGPLSDRLTLHDKPDGIRCPHGGALLADVDGAAEVQVPTE